MQHVFTKTECEATRSNKRADCLRSIKEKKRKQAQHIANINTEHALHRCPTENLFIFCLLLGMPFPLGSNTLLKKHLQCNSSTKRYVASVTKK